MSEGEKRLFGSAHCSVVIDALPSSGSATMPKLWALIGIIVQEAAKIFKLLDDPEANFEKIVAEAEAIFDTYIEPLDIIGVPDWLESYVDEIARKSIRPTIRLLVDTLGFVS